jgi:crotonobetaine/carnitine-CoA ligase
MTVIDREVTLGDLCKRAASIWPERIALVFDETGAELTFNELETQTNQLAYALVDLGTRQGDRIAVVAGNCPIFPIGWIAIAKAGAAMVPVNPGYRDADSLHLLKHAEVSIVIVDESRLELVRCIRELVPAIQHVIVAQASSSSTVLWKSTEHSWPHIARNKPKNSVPCQVNADMLANVQFTSGTTGMPKGCMLSHRYWTQLGQLIAKEFVGLSADDVLLTAQPFSYIDPQWNLAAVLASGARLIVLERFRPSQFWEKVVAYKTTFFYCLGAMPMMLLAQEEKQGDRDHHLKVVMCSGIPKDKHLILEQRFGVKWREVYGTTETGADIMVPKELADDLRGSGSLGNALSHREVLIADENCTPVARGLPGELLIRGTGMMDGYFRNEEATRAAFVNGWYHTGDLAFMNSLGQVTIVGRKKDMIRRSGENIAASEVESIIELHPAVLMAAVIAVPDSLRGEEAKAFVVARPNAGADLLNFEEIANFVETRLAKFKVPRYWEQRSELPRTPSERVAKQMLCESKGHIDDFDRLAKL